MWIGGEKRGKQERHIDSDTVSTSTARIWKRNKRKRRDRIEGKIYTVGTFRKVKERKERKKGNSEE